MDCQIKKSYCTYLFPLISMKFIEIFKTKSDKLKFNYLCSATYACIYLAVYIGKELHIKNEPDVVIGF